MLVSCSLLTPSSQLTNRNFDHFPDWSSKPQEQGEPPEVFLGNHGLPCLLCHLLPWPVHWEWVFFCWGLWLTVFPFLTSTSGASSSTPHINSFMSYATMGILITFIILQGCPGPWALVLFSTTASEMAQHPACTVFMVTSMWGVLPAQLMGPIKLNLTSQVLPKGSPSLSDHCPKNRIASPGPKTTASVINSSRPSWNISAINKPFHALEGWGPVTSSLPQSHSDGDTIACLICMCWVILSMIRH